MTTHRTARTLLAASTTVIWAGALASLLLSVSIAAETSVAIGAMAGVVGVLLTAAALALVTIARAMLDIVTNMARLDRRAVVPAEPETDARQEAEPEDPPNVVGRIEPRFQPSGRIEPTLFRPEAGPGGLRAIRG